MNSASEVRKKRITGYEMLDFYFTSLFRISREINLVQQRVNEQNLNNGGSDFAYSSIGMVFPLVVASSMDGRYTSRIPF